MQTWPSVLPSFLVDGLTKTLTAPILRDPLPGATAQRRVSHRNRMTFAAKLNLSETQIPLFEYFIRDLCNEGAAAFLGPYLDDVGELLAVMRLVSGQYTVQTDGRRFTVATTIEVFV